MVNIDTILSPAYSFTFMLNSFSRWSHYPCSSSTWSHAWDDRLIPTAVRTLERKLSSLSRTRRLPEGHSHHRAGITIDVTSHWYNTIRKNTNGDGCYYETKVKMARSRDYTVIHIQNYSTSNQIR